MHSCGPPGIEFETNALMRKVLQTSQEKSRFLFIGFSTQNIKCTDYKLAQDKIPQCYFPN